jgi:PAS domain S-box-containing protein
MNHRQMVQYELLRGRLEPRTIGAALNETEASAQAIRPADLIRHFPDPALLLDGEGSVLAASEAAAEIFGRSLEELVGRPLADLAGSRDHTMPLHELWSKKGLRNSFGAPVRLEVRHPNGSLGEVELSAGEIGEDKERLVVCSLREIEPFVTLDVSAEVSRCLEAGGRLADQLTRALTMEDAYGVLLPTLCASLSWEAATLWTIGDAAAYECLASWPNDGGAHQVFEDRSRNKPLEDKDIVSRALVTRRPAWGLIGEETLSSGREQAAHDSGLRAAVAFPLTGSDDLHGIVEFLTTRDEPVTTPLRNALGTLGHQIGYLLDDVLARSEAREGERLTGFLLEAATALVGTTDYADALQRLAEVSVPEMADLCLIDVREPHGVIQRMAAIHADPAKAELVAELGRSFPPLQGGLHPSSDVMASGRSHWSSSMPDEYLRATTRDERHYELVKALGFESYMCVPLRADDEILGSITLVSAGSGRRFTERDLALPQELARRAAGIVAAARRYERQHRLTAELQRLLLPEELPVHDNVDICVRYVPAAAEAAAGGDFYDVVRLPSERIGIVIGDIEGHDTLAAATMGQLRSAIRVLAGQLREPSQLVDALRASWELLGFDRIATAVLGRLDQTNGDLVLVSAGHLPPVLLPSDGAPRAIELPPAPPFGAPGPPAVDFHMVLEPGDAVFFYTDGLVEERSDNLEHRMAELLDRLDSLRDKSVQAICDGVLSDLGRAAQPEDDVAVLAIRRQKL